MSSRAESTDKKDCLTHDFQLVKAWMFAVFTTPVVVLNAMNVASTMTGGDSKIFVIGESMLSNTNAVPKSGGVSVNSCSLALTSSISEAVSVANVASTLTEPCVTLSVMLDASTPIAFASECWKSVPLKSSRPSSRV